MTGRKFRCPRCSEVFPVARGATQVACPSCGQALNVGGGTASKGLQRTCPECGERYAVDRSTCPACGAHYKLAQLQGRDAVEGNAEGGGLSPGMRGCSAVLGVLVLVPSAIWFKRAWDAGWMIGLLAMGVAAGVMMIYAAITGNDVAEKARTARRKRRGLPPEPP